MVNHGNGAHFENDKAQMHNYTSDLNKYFLTFMVCNKVETFQNVCLKKLLFH
jgi:hypothetical protein